MVKKNMVRIRRRKRNTKRNKNKKEEEEEEEMTRVRKHIDNNKHPVHLMTRGNE